MTPPARGWVLGLAVAALAVVVANRSLLEPRVDPAAIDHPRVAALRDVDPLLFGDTVDVNVDGMQALESIPGVGPSTAKAIVDGRGREPFYTVDELDRVRGIGPSKLAILDPFVTVGAVGPRPPPTPVDVNTADAALLETLPGLGPTLAARIVADREVRGPFRTVDALDRVKGVGPATVARLRGLVTAG